MCAQEYALSRTLISYTELVNQNGWIVVSNKMKYLIWEDTIIGSRASFGSGVLIFLYLLTTIFLRFWKAYSFNNLKNKVSNFFFGFYAYTIQYCSWKNITNHKKYLGIKSPFHLVIFRHQPPITTTDFIHTIPLQWTKWTFDFISSHYVPFLSNNEWKCSVVEKRTFEKIHKDKICFKIS